MSDALDFAMRMRGAQPRYQFEAPEPERVKKNFGGALQSIMGGAATGAAAAPFLGPAAPYAVAAGAIIGGASYFFSGE
jgi:hypothetical protein